MVIIGIDPHKSSFTAPWFAESRETSVGILGIQIRVDCQQCSDGNQQNCRGIQDLSVLFYCAVGNSTQRDNFQ